MNQGTSVDKVRDNIVITVIISSRSTTNDTTGNKMEWKIEKKKMLRGTFPRTMY